MSPSSDFAELVEAFRAPATETATSVRVLDLALLARARRAGLVRHDPEILAGGHLSAWWGRGGSKLVLVWCAHGEWLWAPETWGYADRVRHAPTSETEAGALAAAVRWIESGKPPPPVPNDERPRSYR